jgi:hypothetical protein
VTFSQESRLVITCIVLIALFLGYLAWTERSVESSTPGRLRALSKAQSRNAM